jgi:DnaJ-class molecular chaperone
MDKDYYKIIGLTNTAGVEEIKKAYRALAMKYHPDRNKDDPACEERLKEINEAYRVLGNDEKRRLYDFFRQSNSGSATLRNHNLDEIFASGVSSLFREAFGRRGACHGRGMGMGCRRWKWKP